MARALAAAQSHLGVPALFEASDEQPDDKCVLLYLAVLKRAIYEHQQSMPGSTFLTPQADGQASTISASAEDSPRSAGEPPPQPSESARHGTAALHPRPAVETIVRSGADLSEEELRRLQARLLYGEGVDPSAPRPGAPVLGDRAPPPLPPELRDEAGGVPGPPPHGKPASAVGDEPGAAGRMRLESAVSGSVCSNAAVAGSMP